MTIQLKRAFVGLAGGLAFVVLAAASVGCDTRRTADGDQGGKPGTAGSASGGGGGAATTSSTGGAGGASTASGGAVGTSGSGGAGATSGSGVDPTKTVGSLAVPDRKKLCDWDANLSGGYGKTTMCSSGATTTSDPSQDACVNNWPTDCTTTVGDYEACARALAADPCDITALFSPECQNVSDACL